ncbi:DUF3877 family protein [Lacrimispora indolis]|uniref:DUF3877 family protein n=1 Tax=Lacrimispora indolis TaxID=69825 RepID=UPI00045E60DB|nr:DUF3877 family protein [Lacrimispora indolis]
MQIQYESAFKGLENHIIEVIKEEQIKIGYRSEIIRLYYPIESICNLLGTSYTVTELFKVLDQFCEFVKERLGIVEYSNTETRFCFTIPPKGVDYVHESIDENYFLRDFIEKISIHDCSLEDLLNIFYKYSSNVVCEKMNNGEFDYLIYFTDGKPDAYRYCIKFEDCHTIYHRFIKADYENFGF